MRSANKVKVQRKHFVVARLLEFFERRKILCGCFGSHSSMTFLEDAHSDLVIEFHNLGYSKQKQL